MEFFGRTLTCSAVYLPPVNEYTYSGSGLRCVTPDGNLKERLARFSRQNAYPEQIGCDEGCSES